MVVGALLVVSNLLVAGWGLVAYRRSAAPGRMFTHALALAQTLVIAEALLGLILVSDGLHPGQDLHFAYGLLPLVAVAYPYALRTEDGRRNLLFFSLGSAVVAALGIRAYMTGPP